MSGIFLERSSFYYTETVDEKSGVLAMHFFLFLVGNECFTDFIFYLNKIQL